MKKQNNKANAFQHKRQPQDTKLYIECTLIGGMLPMFEITYKNRLIQGFFEREIWNNKTAIIQMAKNVVENQHKVKPFNLNNDE